MELKNTLFYLSEHYSCFIHTIGLVARDGYKQVGSMINNVLAKTSCPMLGDR